MSEMGKKESFGARNLPKRKIETYFNLDNVLMISVYIIIQKLMSIIASPDLSSLS